MAESLPSPPVDGDRQRARAVDVLVDDGVPVVGEIAGQLVAHAVVVDGKGGGQQQRVAVPSLPQTVDHRGHQAQHASGALKLGEGGPVRVESVEDLGMNRVGGPDAAFVVGSAALRGKLDLLQAIQFGEGPGGDVALREGVRPGERFEQPPAHNLEALLGAGRPPRRVDPAQHVAQPIQGAAPANASDLGVVRLGVGRIGSRDVGSRQRDHQQTVARELHRLGQRLGESELSLEAARRQIGVVVKLARVGDPLVDQHQAGPVLLQQLPQHVPGTGRPLIIGAHPLESLPAAELVGELAPYGAHHRAVRFGHRVSR